VSDVDYCVLCNIGYELYLDNKCYQTTSSCFDASCNNCFVNHTYYCLECQGPKKMAYNGSCICVSPNYTAGGSGECACNYPTYDEYSDNSCLLVGTSCSDIHCDKCLVDH